MQRNRAIRSRLFASAILLAGLLGCGDAGPPPSRLQPSSGDLGVGPSIVPDGSRVVSPSADLGSAAAGSIVVPDTSMATSDASMSPDSQARVSPPDATLVQDSLPAPPCSVDPARCVGVANPRATPGRVAVLPLLFVPQDASLPSVAVRRLIWQHIVVAQSKYRSLLRTDTFRLAQDELWVYRAERQNAGYLLAKGAVPNPSHLIAAELLREKGLSRVSSRLVFLIFYVRPAGRPCAHNDQGPGPHCFGGGVSFNGGNSAQGGIAILELPEATEAMFPSGTQAAILHELGHAFSLAHVSNCDRDEIDPDQYGQRSSPSIMSYSRSTYTVGLQWSQASLLADELEVLDENDAVFPDFSYQPAQATRACYVPHMPYLPYGRTHEDRSLGYALSFDGRPVGHEPFWSLSVATQHCRNITRQRPTVHVQCSYNGNPL